MSYMGPRDLRWLDAIWLVIAFTVLYFLFSEGRPHAAEPRQITFYHDGDVPPCKDKKYGYVIVSGPLYTTEHHRVWICGLGVR